MAQDNSTDKTIKDYSHNGGMQNESGSGLGSKHNQNQKNLLESSESSKPFPPSNGSQNG